jgi:hypothetical protein
MIAINKPTKNDYPAFKYENAYAFGALGYLEKTLQDIAPLFKDEKLEFAEVITQNNNEFLAGAYHSPYRDITIERFPNKRSSIMVCGLDYKETERVNKEIINKSGLKIIKPDEQFILELTMMSQSIAALYSQAEIIAGSLREYSVSSEQIWELMKYTYFLNKYKHHPEKEAMTLAANKLNIPKEAANKLKKGFL